MEPFVSCLHATYPIFTSSERTGGNRYRSIIALGGIPPAKSKKMISKQLKNWMGKKGNQGVNSVWPVRSRCTIYNKLLVEPDQAKAVNF
jgi:hypothetical protein